MDSKGYELVVETLGGAMSGYSVYPQPRGDENIKGISITCPQNKEPIDAYNALADKGFIQVEGKLPEDPTRSPRFAVIGMATTRLSLVDLTA